MKVTINDDCTGCGLCVGVCPAVFDMNDDSLAIVLLTPVPAEHETDCRDAAEGCPVEAIEIAD